MRAFVGCLLAWAGCAPVGPDDAPEQPSPPPSAVDPPAPAPTPEPEPIAVPPRYPGPCQARADARGAQNMALDGVFETTVAYDYDDQARLIERRTRTPEELRTERFTYDAAGRIETVEIDTPRYTQLERSTYDAAGRLHTIDKSNDEQAPKWRTVHRYDARGRLVAREEQRIAPRRVTFRRAFEHDGDRLVRERVDNEGKRNWPLTIAIVYDDDGRIVERIREWDDRPAPAEVERFEYDDDGRLRRRTRESSSGLSTSVVFEYDAAGNVLVVDALHDGAGITTAHTEYTYDCWTELPADYEVLVPFDFRTRLDEIPPISL